MDSNKKNMMKASLERRPRNAGDSLISSDLRSEVKYIDVNCIVPYRKQARTFFDNDELDNLAESIKSQGIIQPLQVIPSHENLNHYEVVSGERRLLAAKSIKLEKVPCIVLDAKKDSEFVSLIENIQREDLHPIDLANALHELTQNTKHGEKSNVALKLGISSSLLSQYLSVAKLPQDIKEALIEKKNASLKFLLNLSKLSNKELMREKIKEREIHKVKNSLLKISSTGGDFKIELLNKKMLTPEKIVQLKSLLEEFIKTL
tara:strand:- start:1748 stop:2530 length:783 start_codon:yes stop_codon:yes gene_type:complete